MGPFGRRFVESGDAMKRRIVGVVPARWGSSRFEGKPLADLCGKPMIWWVWSRARQAPSLEEVVVATDDERIRAACEGFGALVRMTSSRHETATDRLCEVADQVPADLYVMVNGDEPLVSGADVERVIPADFDPGAVVVTNLMTSVVEPAEIVDVTNLKVVVNARNEALFISRSPIPYPKGGVDFRFQKFVGVGAFTRPALDWYRSTPRGPVESIEENDSFRFIENGKPVLYFDARCKTLSVDTPADRLRVEARLRSIGAVG